MICQRRLVLIVFLWWFWRSLSLNFPTYQMNYSVCVWRNLVFQTAGRSHLCSLYLMFGKGLWLEATALLAIFLGLVKSLITFKNAAFCQIFSVISGPLDQLQIFWQLYLINLVFNRSWATQAAALSISKAFERVWQT